MSQSDNIYYDNYIKYKKMYIDNKNININGGNNEEDFYFIHSVLDFQTLVSILKDGVIYSGKYIQEEKRKLSKKEPLNYVYTNIYFNDLKNIKQPWGFDIILSPKILYDKDLIFNKGWLVNPGIPEVNSYYVNKNDSIEKKNIQLKKIKKYIIKNTNEKTAGAEILTHEVLFKDKIKLDDYLIGVICSKCNKYQINKIKKILKHKNYKKCGIFEIDDMSKLII